MRTMLYSLLLGLLSLPLPAQLAAPGESGVVMGHLHIRVSDVERQQRFWTEGMGATAIPAGNLLIMKLPGSYVLLQKGQQSGGTDESTVHHLAFNVRNLKQAVDRALAAGAKLLPPPATPGQAFVMAPDDIRVEFTEVPSLAAPVEHHHVHFYTADPLAAQAWYAKTFGGKVGRRGKFEAVDLPGANLSFSPAKTAPAPTKGRALDHIGFEVKGLEAFCKKLEASGIKLDVPYRTVPALKLSLAFLTDPWGTYIELTEGLGSY